MTETTPPTNPFDAAAATVLDWDGPNVFHVINISEARTLADAFDALGRPDVGTHIMRETWEAEHPDDRDPLPWLYPNGTRHHEQPATTDVAGPRFDPRSVWDASDRDAAPNGGVTT